MGKQIRMGNVLWASGTVLKIKHHQDKESEVLLGLAHGEVVHLIGEGLSQEVLDGVRAEDTLGFYGYVSDESAPIKVFEVPKQTPFQSRMELRLKKFQEKTSLRHRLGLPRRSFWRKSSDTELVRSYGGKDADFKTMRPWQMIQAKQLQDRPIFHQRPNDGMPSTPLFQFLAGHLTYLSRPVYCINPATLPYKIAGSLKPIHEDAQRLAYNLAKRENLSQAQWQDMALSSGARYLTGASVSSWGYRHTVEEQSIQELLMPWVPEAIGGRWDGARISGLPGLAFLMKDYTPVAERIRQIAAHEVSHLLSPFDGETRTDQKEESFADCHSALMQARASGDLGGIQRLAHARQPAILGFMEKHRTGPALIHLYQDLMARQEKLPITDLSDEQIYKIAHHYADHYGADIEAYQIDRNYLKTAKGDFYETLSEAALCAELPRAQLCEFWHARLNDPKMSSALKEEVRAGLDALEQHYLDFSQEQAETVEDEILTDLNQMIDDVLDVVRSELPEGLSTQQKDEQLLRLEAAILISAYQLVFVSPLEGKALQELSQKCQQSLTERFEKLEIEQRMKPFKPVGVSFQEWFAQGCPASGDQVEFAKIAPNREEGAKALPIEQVPAFLEICAASQLDLYEQLSASKNLSKLADIHGQMRSGQMQEDVYYDQFNQYPEISILSQLLHQQNIAHRFYALAKFDQMPLSTAQESLFTALMPQHFGGKRFEISYQDVRDSQQKIRRAEKGLKSRNSKALDKLRARP